VTICHETQVQFRFNLSLSRFRLENTSLNAFELVKEETMKRKSIVLLIVVVSAAAVAALAQKTAKRQYIAASNPYFQQRGGPPYSNGVLVGDTLYVAGHIGQDPKTGKVPSDVDQEVKFLLDSIKATLAQGGMTMDDMVMVQVHCPDLSLYDKFNAIYRTYFSKDFPARAFLGSGPLLFGGHFEMLGIAVKR
jgi:2-iminobutanoate/2-iminopropanoate deaminase